VGGRGAGIGTRLLRAAEDEAVRPGCVGAPAETFSFEARPFYEKPGYRVHGDMEGQPPGHWRLAMNQRLRETGSACLAGHGAR
jgi:GNAT superfamily N-acetyltransferase